jgi:hypothetical protein
MRYLYVPKDAHLDFIISEYLSHYGIYFDAAVCTLVYSDVAVSSKYAPTLLRRILFPNICIVLCVPLNEITDNNAYITL